MVPLSSALRSINGSSRLNSMQQIKTTMSLGFFVLFVSIVSILEHPLACQGAAAGALDLEITSATQNQTTEAEDGGKLAEKFRFYSQLLSEKVAPHDEKENENILQLLTKVRLLEEAESPGANGVARTQLENELIGLADVNEDRCLQLHYFPRLSWLKRRFKTAPAILAYLEDIERRQVEVCRFSYESDFALASNRVEPDFKLEISRLRKAIGSMGVYLISVRDIPEQPFIEGVSEYLLTRLADHKELAPPGSQTPIESDASPNQADEPEREPEQQQQETNSSSALPLNGKLNELEVKEKLKQFTKAYKRLVSNCKKLLRAMLPVLQVVRVLGDRVLDQDQILSDWQANTIVCNNFVHKPQLASAFGERLVDKIELNRAKLAREANQMKPIALNRKRRSLLQFLLST